MFNLLRTQGILRQIGRQVKQQCSPVLSVRCMTSNTGLSLIYEGDLAVIKMEKDDNRLNQDFFNIFHDFLDQVEGNAAIKGIITTGKGKFFSNGLDLDWMGTLSTEEMLSFMNSFAHFVRRILFFPVPTSAAINGHAFAGGAVLAFAHDFRVMNAEKGWICFNEVHLDKRLFQFLSTFLRSKLGHGLNANDALVFGSRYTAEEAVSNKLIHAKAPSIDLLEHSIKLLHSYVGKNGLNRNTLRSVKEDVYRDSLEAFDKQLKDIDFAKQFMTSSQTAGLDKA